MLTFWASIDQVPNPSKVLIILEELHLPYESSWVELDGLKQKPYTDVNPNGRVPAIEDPNHNVTLWESGAIVQVRNSAIYYSWCLEGQVPSHGLSGPFGTVFIRIKSLLCFT